MSTAGLLNDRPKTELAALARRRGIHGYESMNKGELVKALSRSVAAVKHKASKPASAKPPVKPAKPTPKPLPKPAAKSAAKVTRPAKPAAKPSRTVRPAPVARTASPTANGSHRRLTATPSVNGTPKSAAKAPTRPQPAPSTKPAAAPAVARDAGKDKEAPAPRHTGPQAKDRIFLAVTDPYWLHVVWDISALSIQRAEAALKQDWYGARRIIRLSDVTSQDTTSTSETPIRDIPVEGDGHNWYINVPQPPRQYRADIGYLSRRGDFFVLARSNVVTPPKAGSSEALDIGWEKDPKKAERILAMSTGFESPAHPELKELFEERLGRLLGAPKDSGFGHGATPPGSVRKFFFDLAAELIVYGRSDPTAHVTLGNDPIKLKPDGTFFMRFSLPDSRQIIPAVATSSDGVEERTIVLAVERNTKYLDPMIHDQMNEI